MPQTNPHDTYTSPLASRNASPEMCRIWSPRHKFTTWRKIWLAVAEAQQACGLDITDEQINEMKAALDVTDEDMDNAAKYERDLRHDVMAHVHAFGDRCPSAKGIIHLGCTSQDVVCNADNLVLSDAIGLIFQKATRVVISLGETGDLYKTIPTLGFTHYQSAQPVTVGRRMAGWAYDIKLSQNIHADTMPKPRGFKGATGTQASFLKLFGGDSNLVDEFEVRALNLLSQQCFGRELHPFDSATLERTRQTYLTRAETNPCGDGEIKRLEMKDGIDGMRAEAIRLGVGGAHELTGQTYPRVVDTAILAKLASIAAVLHKIATDIRLLSNRKEIDEPFGKNQIGSSAMPYKRNPMKCERICGLTRFVMNLVGNAYDTAATQWLERTLDDSSNRRLSLPEAFLALDGALDLMHTVASGLVVNEAMVRKNLMLELPFMATENILMEAVKAGGDRQDLHEKIRVHSQAAGHRVKQEGLDNDLIARLKADPSFDSIHHMLTEDQILNPMNFIGRSVEQTERFLKEVVEPLKNRYAKELDSLGAADRGV